MATPSLYLHSVEPATVPTELAERLAKHFGLTSVARYGCPAVLMVETFDTLIIAREPFTGDVRQMAFAEAVAAALPATVVNMEAAVKAFAEAYFARGTTYAPDRIANAITAALPRLIPDMEALRRDATRKLLLRYGRHDADCAYCHDSATQDRPVCTCGLDAALAAQGCDTSDAGVK